MKKPFAIVMSLLLFGVPAGRALAGSTVDEAKTKGLLVAGVKGASPPFGFLDRDTGQFAGYDVDVVKAIAARLGAKPIFTPVTASNRIPELLEGSIDLIAATMTKSPDRGRLVDFSDPYFRASQKVIAKKGAVHGLADFKGKRIGTAKGSAWEFNLRAKVPGAAIVAFDDSAEAIGALGKGEIDAISIDERILAAILPRLPQGVFEIAPVTIAEEPYVIAVRKGDKQLLEVVNGAIRDMERSGQAQKLNDKWFAREPGSSPPPTGSAAGVVVRRAADVTRFVVMPMEGLFRAGADVSFFDPAGNVAARGKVKSFYTDEVYVDIDPAKADAVDYGFVVVMNGSDAAARDFIGKKRDVLKSVTEQIRGETVARQEKIEKSEEAMEKQRRQEQVEYERLRMQLDSSYDNYYYNWHRW